MIKGSVAIICIGDAMRDICVINKDIGIQIRCRCASYLPGNMPRPNCKLFAMPERN